MQIKDGNSLQVKHIITRFFLLQLFICFTIDAIIKYLNEKKCDIVFMLWGAHAQKKGSSIKNSVSSNI